MQNSNVSALSWATYGRKMEGKSHMHVLRLDARKIKMNEMFSKDDALALRTKPRRDNAQISNFMKEHIFINRKHE